jgi:hypothetical protein
MHCTPRLPFPLTYFSQSAASHLYLAHAHAECEHLVQQRHVRAMTQATAEMGVLSFTDVLLAATLIVNAVALVNFKLCAALCMCVCCLNAYNNVCVRVCGLV